MELACLGFYPISVTFGNHHCKSNFVSFDAGVGSISRGTTIFTMAEPLTKKAKHEHDGIACAGHSALPDIIKIDFKMHKEARERVVSKLGEIETSTADAVILIAVDETQNIYDADMEPNFRQGRIFSTFSESKSQV